MSQLLERNALATGRARIRLTLSAGSGKPGDLALGADHLLWMSAAVLLEAPEATAVSIAPFPRNEHSPLAGLKCASYAENLLALFMVNGLAVDRAPDVGFQVTACRAGVMSKTLRTCGAGSTGASFEVGGSFTPAGRGG